LAARIGFDLSFPCVSLWFNCFNN